MPASITGPLLVTLEQLDAAIAVVERTAREANVALGIEARIDIDPEIPSAPPVELLVLSVLSEPSGGFDGFRNFMLDVKRAPKVEGLYVPTLPIETLTLPEW